MELISNNGFWHGYGLAFMKSGGALAAKIIDIDRQQPCGDDTANWGQHDICVTVWRLAATAHAVDAYAALDTCSVAATATLPAPSVASASTASAGDAASRSAMSLYRTVSQISCKPQMTVPSPLGRG